MTRVLLTAFGPYDRWQENSSWSAVVELTNWYDGEVELVTRRYPVDLTAMSDQLRRDLLSGFDFAVHLGQSPGTAVVKMESTGLNRRSGGEPLLSDAPEAYRSPIALEPIATTLCDHGIPAEVSHHAGTYLCNASLYLSMHYVKQLGLPTHSLFVHLPVTPSESARHVRERLPSMTPTLSSMAIALVVDGLADGQVPPTANEGMGQIA